MYKDILIPIDLEHESSWLYALPVALEWCGKGGSNLHMLTVVPDFGMSIVSQYFPDGYKDEVSKKILEQLKSFSAENVSDAVNVRHIVGEGRAYEVILRIADEIGADLIVMASHRTDLKDFLLGPNAARVVRHARCSVMVARG